MKKLTTIIVMSAVLIVNVILATSAFAGIESNQGFDLLTTSMVKMQNIKNCTANVSLKLSDNGKEMQTITGELKCTEDQKASGNFEMKCNGISQSTKFWYSENKLVLKQGNESVYMVFELGNLDVGSNKIIDDKKMLDQISGITNSPLIGNLKNKIEIKNLPDGSKEFSLKLNNSEISDIIKMFMANMLPPSLNDLKDGNSQIAPEQDIKEIRVGGIIDKTGQFSKCTLEVNITGKDFTGEAHSTNLNASVELKNINSTTPDKIDLTGKKVETVKMPDIIGAIPGAMDLPSGINNINPLDIGLPSKIIPQNKKIQTKKSTKNNIKTTKNTAVKTSQVEATKKPTNSTQASNSTLPKTGENDPVNYVFVGIGILILGASILLVNRKVSMMRE